MKYIFLFLLISNLCLAQINNPENGNNYFSEETAEKVVFNTDRGVYLSGEKIWFNAFCFIPNKTTPINLSNVLYLELYNSSREFLVKRKFTVTNGNVYGSIDIPSEFLSGNYFLRAYTQFLKNSPPEDYSTSFITIINPNIALPEKTKTISKDSIQIIPNGGKLIDGIKTQVVFKIQEDLNKKIKNIFIIDHEANIISSPSISRNGIGIFEITPAKLSNYAIKLLLDNNDSIVKPLPEISEKGMIIKTKISSNNQLIVDITNKKDPSGETNQDYRFIIRSQNSKILTETTLNLINGASQLKFSTDILDEGMNDLVIKDKKDNVVNFSSFYNKNKPIEIKANTQKKNYAKRELVKLNISSSGLNNINLSAAVVKKGTSNNSGILFKYIIENPQLLKSYLQNINNADLLSNEQIDILMICYNSMLSQNFDNNMFEKNRTAIQWMPEIRDVSISGIVYNKSNNLPVADIPVYISAFEENPQVHIYKSQQNGEFVFSLNNLVDHQDIFLCTGSDSGNEIGLRINNDFSPKFPTTKDIPLSIDTSYQTFLEEMYINMQAGEIFKTKTGTKQLPEINFPFNLGAPSISVMIDDYVKTPTLETFLREIIPSIRVQKKKNQYFLSIFDDEKNIFYHEPLIFVDNIPIFNINNLLEIPMPKIVRIDIFIEPLLLGEKIINGVIMLSTNTDDFGGVKIPEGSIFLEYQTISPSFGFDPPNYNTEDKKTNRLADFRNLLYWNPNLNITNDTSVSFYASDHCSEYDVIIRGYTEDGKYCYGKTSINVISGK